ncbi:MAG: penicillin-binding protein 2 [Pseudomonadota bacterium]
MIRRPLRPLARVVWARGAGIDPDAEEAARRAAMLRRQRVEERQRAEWRLLLLGVTFVLAFGAVAGRMALLASTDPEEPRIARNTAPISTTRADIVDRNGLVLATNLITTSLYVETRLLVDPRAAAEGLVEIFPEMEVEALHRRLTDGRTFLWLKRALSPEQQQAVHDLGEPGLRFGPREIRLYPNGARAAHILGGTSFGREGVRAAEIVGTAGIERHLDAELRDPARGSEPLRLSVDLRVQNALRDVLGGAIEQFTAKGAAGLMMDVETGEVLALVSLPDFDPNDRPRPVAGDGALSPRFNRVAQGVYELGSTFKLFTAAQALEQGIADPSTMIDTRGPMHWGRHRIRDFRNYGPELSLTDVIVRSSNIGTAHLAMAMGRDAQQDFLHALGLFSATDIELSEAARGRPLLPPRWSEISTITVSYGHGISATPLHLAAAYATLTNGGLRVRPTLLAGAEPPGEDARVISPATSRVLRDMLRQVVTRGTASFADIEGYQVGGKTGTADKPRLTGGYHDDRVLATFAAVFPTSRPRYVLVVTLDEPTDRSGREPRRSAGWTAVPATAEAIRRIAPILGMRPMPTIAPESPGTLLVRGD